MSRLFRSVFALSLVGLLVGLLPLGAADASTKKHFTQVYTCGTSDDSDKLGSASDLTSYVNLGHWTGSSNPGHPCAGGKTFHPSVTGVKITFRWYAGSTLLRTSAGRPALHAPGRFDDLHRSVTGKPGVCRYFLHGKKITARATISKAGYVSKVVTLGCFPGVE